MIKTKFDLGPYYLKIGELTREATPDIIVLANVIKYFTQCANNGKITTEEQITDENIKQVIKHFKNKTKL